ncbi:hypothetical protein HDU81_002994 [Chytriomyces hyalinus]|nr:hypothetical protein HDU81_002994 [Chytriomyces hyalinus]
MSRRAGCFSMAGSTVCGSDFATQFAYIDPQEASRSFKDLTTFDQYMTSFADDNPQFKVNMDLYGCTRFNGTGLRYHMTAYCATFPTLAIALIAALVVVIAAAISVWIYRRRHRVSMKPATPEPEPPQLVHKATMESTAHHAIQSLGSRAYTVQDASRGYAVLAEKRRGAEEFMNGAFHGPNAAIENSSASTPGGGAQQPGLELANFVRGRAATTFEKRDLGVPSDVGPSGAGVRISTMQSDPKLWNEERVADFVYANGGGNLNSFKIVKEQHIDGMKLLTHSFETLTLVLQIPVEKHEAFEAALAALRFRILNQEASLSRPPAYQSI